MKIAIVLGSPKISGGTYVILQHALYVSATHDVHIVTKKQILLSEKEKWHPAFDKLNFKTFETADHDYDLAIATWWESPFLLPLIRSKQYAYFVQSIEAYFFDQKNLVNQYVAHSSYDLGLPVITEATWIKEDLQARFGSTVCLVRNGINKDWYTPDGQVIKPKQAGKLRCLVEGPLEMKLKAVPETIEALKKSKCDEIWLLTSSEVESVPGVDRVFSRVPPSEVGAIYRSCDVLVKQSYVEGMFGPPLEMFHCGGTALVTNVTGYDEYIIDGINALVNPIGDWGKLIENVNTLKEDPSLLKRLQAGAQLTADNWPNWETQSSQFQEALEYLVGISSVDRGALESKILHVMQMKDLMLKILRNNWVEKNTGNVYPLRLTANTTDSVKKLVQWKPKKLNTISKPRIMGIAISNEHIEELWNPVIKKNGWDYLYVCMKERGNFTLWKHQPDNALDGNKYFHFNWINKSEDLFALIKTFKPTCILIHNGSHPAYQHVLREINQRFHIPIVFSELGWFPQRGRIYFDPLGTNAASSIAKDDFKALTHQALKISYQELEFRSNKVLLVLQLENDMNFIKANDYFSSNFSLIRNVLDSVPCEYEIWIKPHPLDHNSYYYSEWEGDRVKVVNGNIENLLKEVCSVIAINSTCLLQALDFEVNIYKCGHSILDNKGVVFEFDNKNLKNVWKDKFVNNMDDRKKLKQALINRQINVFDLDESSVSLSKKILNYQYRSLYK